MLMNDRLRFWLSSFHGPLFTPLHPVHHSSEQFACNDRRVGLSSDSASIYNTLVARKLEGGTKKRRAPTSDPTPTPTPTPPLRTDVDIRGSEETLDLPTRFVSEVQASQEVVNELFEPWASRFVAAYHTILLLSKSGANAILTAHAKTERDSAAQALVDAWGPYAEAHPWATLTLPGIFCAADVAKANEKAESDAWTQYESSIYFSQFSDDARARTIELKQEVERRRQINLEHWSFCGFDWSWTTAQRVLTYLSDSFSPSSTHLRTPASIWMKFLQKAPSQPYQTYSLLVESSIKYAENRLVRDKIEAERAAAVVGECTASFPVAPSLYGSWGETQRAWFTNVRMEAEDIKDADLQARRFEQLVALATYVGTDAHFAGRARRTDAGPLTFNHYLRGIDHGGDSEDASALVHWLAKLIDESPPTPCDFLVMRGGPLGGLRPCRRGQLRMEPSFVSTSVSRRVALTFAEEHDPEKRRWAILIPKGTRALFIGALRRESKGNDGEDEILLQKGGHFQCIGDYGVDKIPLVQIISAPGDLKLLDDSVTASTDERRKRVRMSADAVEKGTRTGYDSETEGTFRKYV